MQDGPRHRNQTFDTASIGGYLSDYASRLAQALDGVDKQALERAFARIVTAADEGRHVYAIGNGGSAAIADHLCCDWTKGAHHPDHPTLRTHSLAANMALYSAVANDYGFDAVFARQLDYYGQPGDVLLAISSSGDSANILAAVARARALGMTTIGLCGFGGGQLKTAADIALHVDAHNYGIVEDAHQALMHVIAQFIQSRRQTGA